MPKSMFKIRRAIINDVHGILKVHQDSIRSVASKDYSSEQISGWSDHLVAEKYIEAMNDGEEMFVAEDGNKLVVGFSSYKNDEVYALYVSSIAISKGVGKKLYQAIENLAISRNCKQLTLSSSITAMEFYKRQGFQIIEHSIYRLSSGIEIPCIKMVKPLSQSSSG